LQKKVTVNWLTSPPDFCISYIRRPNFDGAADMIKKKVVLNGEVTKFLESLNHPFRKEIEQLRLIILKAGNGLTENVKWNGPNYCDGDDDRITMRVQPPKQIQLIFHRGAKKLKQPQDKLIDDNSGLLVWKENDRAVATFKSKSDIERMESALTRVVQDWIIATRT
jgi:hypothetical protein